MKTQDGWMISARKLNQTDGMSKLILREKGHVQSNDESRRADSTILKS